MHYYSHMRLARFSIKNYRGFKQPATLTLRPLTLLFGYNSAGKSALARFLPLLSDSVQAAHSSLIDFSSTSIRGARLRTLLSRFPPYEPVLSFSLDWDLEGSV